MFNPLFGKTDKETSKPKPSDLFDPRMPDVDDLPEIEEVFDRARKAAAGELTPPNGAPGERHVILVTPGRMLLFRPCPPAGSMSAGEVAAIEKMLSSSVKRNIAVIACTELKAITADIAKVIPFLGFLMGFAYIGHAVWIFEGHPSALAAGCQEADLLMVDGGMVPYLQEDWIKVASGAMRKSEIYVHDRQTYSLRQVS